MKTVTAIIVEDEEYSRLSLEEKLRIYHPQVKVVSTCEDCDTAMERILEHCPDILFLDIELPGKNALWLVKRLKEISSLSVPFIIFTTAFSESEYLLHAIKLEAIDYLIKPVNLDELTQSIHKALRKIEEKEKNSLPGNTSNGRHFRFRTHNSYLNLKESDIVCFEADSYCAKLYLANGTTELLFERLADIERRLADVECMCRVGRKYVVNCDYVYKLNVKNDICYFQLPSGQSFDITLSEGGMSTLMNRISSTK